MCHWLPVSRDGPHLSGRPTPRDEALTRVDKGTLLDTTGSIASTDGGDAR